MICVIRNNNTTIVKMLLNDDYICENINRKNIKYLNYLGEEITYDYITFLQYAIMNQNYSIIKLFLEHPDIDISRESDNYHDAMEFAKYIEDEEIIKMIEEHPKYKQKPKED